MSGKRVKIAAVGLGNRTCKYLRYVAEHQDIAELVAVVDTDAARFAKVQGPFALPADRCFDSLDSLAESGLEVDACIIGTPDIHHHQMALQAMRYGWHTRSEGKTYVNFDLKQMGVACVNSWGAWPREEHLVKGSQFEFTFYISPVNN